jgi:hypothetical protein
MSPMIDYGCKANLWGLSGKMLCMRGIIWKLFSETLFDVSVFYFFPNFKRQKFLRILLSEIFFDAI